MNGAPSTADLAKATQFVRWAEALGRVLRSVETQNHTTPLSESPSDVADRIVRSAQPAQPAVPAQAARSTQTLHWCAPNTTTLPHAEAQCDRQDTHGVHDTHTKHDTHGVYGVYGVHGVHSRHGRYNLRGMHDLHGMHTSALSMRAALSEQDDDTTRAVGHTSRDTPLAEEDHQEPMSSAVPGEAGCCMPVPNWQLANATARGSRTENTRLAGHSPRCVRDIDVDWDARVQSQRALSNFRNALRLSETTQTRPSEVMLRDALASTNLSDVTSEADSRDSYSPRSDGDPDTDDSETSDTFARKPAVKYCSCGRHVMHHYAGTASTHECKRCTANRCLALMQSLLAQKVPVQDMYRTLSMALGMDIPDRETQPFHMERVWEIMRHAEDVQSAVFGPGLVCEHVWVDMVDHLPKCLPKKLIRQTLNVRLLTAPHCTNAMFYFVVLANVALRWMSVRKKYQTLVRAAEGNGLQNYARDFAVQVLECLFPTDESDSEEW